MPKPLTASISQSNLAYFGELFSIQPQCKFSSSPEKTHPDPRCSSRVHKGTPPRHHRLIKLIGTFSDQNVASFAVVETKLHLLPHRGRIFLRSTNRQFIEITLNPGLTSIPLPFIATWKPAKAKLSSEPETPLWRSIIRPRPTLPPEAVS